MRSTPLVGELQHVRRPPESQTQWTLVTARQEKAEGQRSVEDCAAELLFKLFIHIFIYLYIYIYSLLTV